jgi:hypothetical protein
VFAIVYGQRDYIQVNEDFHIHLKTESCFWGGNKLPNCLRAFPFLSSVTEDVVEQFVKVFPSNQTC